MRPWYREYPEINRPLRCIVVAFWCTQTSLLISNVDLSMGHQIASLPLPDNKAGTDLGRGFASGEPQWVCRSF